MILIKGFGKYLVHHSNVIAPRQSAIVVRAAAAFPCFMHGALRLPLRLRRAKRVYKQAASSPKCASYAMCALSSLLYSPNYRTSPSWLSSVS